MTRPINPDRANANPLREHIADTGELVGEHRVVELLGKTATDFETPDEVALRATREDPVVGQSIVPNNENL